MQYFPNHASLRALVFVLVVGSCSNSHGVSHVPDDHGGSDAAAGSDGGGSADAKAARIELLPAGMVLAPGGTSAVTATVFSDTGAELNEVEVSWELKGGAVSLMGDAARRA